MKSLPSSPSAYPERGSANYPASDTENSFTRPMAATEGLAFISDENMNASAKPPEFLETVSTAVTQLKQRLQQNYEQAYPALIEIIHLVLDEEESNAWELSAFPHLLLPDLVEAHVAKLNLQPAETKREDVFAPHHFELIPAFAGC